MPRAPALEPAAAGRLLGRALFLGAAFLMVAGDWPPAAVPGSRWLFPLRALAWPWLYIALFAASFAVLAWAGGLGVRARTRFDVLRPALAVVTVAFLLSAAFSQVPSLSWPALACFVGVVGFALAAAQVVEDEATATATSLVVAAAALCLAVRVIAWRLDEGLAVPAFHVRNNAWLGKLQLAAVLSLVGPLLLARFLAVRQPAVAALHGVGWVLGGAALQLLHARTASVAFALTTVVLCALNPAYRRRWVVVLLTLLAVALAVAALAPATFLELAASLLRFPHDAGIGMRWDVWRETLAMIADHPITGIGLGTYDDVAYTQYGTSGERHFFRNGWHAHNVILHVLAETGVVGLLAWGYVWYVLVRLLVRTWRHGDAQVRLHATAALGVVVAFFVLSLTEDLIASRVHASLRMSLTLGLLLACGVRQASRPGPAAPGPV